MVESLSDRMRPPQNADALNLARPDSDRRLSPVGKCGSTNAGEAGKSGEEEKDFAIIGTYCSRILSVSQAMYQGRQHRLPRAIASGAVGIVLLGTTGCEFVARSELLSTFDRSAAEAAARAEIIAFGTDEPSQVLPLVRTPAQARAAELERLATEGKPLDRVRARYLLAGDLLDADRPQAARVWLDALEEDYPVLAPHIFLKRGLAYQRAGDEAQAREAWYELTQNYADSPVVAEALYWEGKINAQAWDRLLAEYPQHPRSHEIARDRLKSNPNQLALLRMLARYLPDLPEGNEIRDRLVKQHASQLTPPEWEAIAEGYWNKWQYGKAAQAYAKAPRTPRNLYRAARGVHIEKRTQQAKAAYKVLVEAFPNAHETGLGLRHLATLSSRQEALTYLDRAIADFPQEAPKALLSKSKLLDAAGSKTSASQARELLLTNYSRSAAVTDFRWEQAQNAASAGNLELAVKWAQPIAIDNLDSEVAPKAGYWLGKWQQQLGQSEAARQSFERVLRGRPESYFAWRSAVKLGLPVGDFTTIRNVSPVVNRPRQRSLPPAGSDSFKELYLLGQDIDALALWRYELAGRTELTVNEQYTLGLLQLTQGQNLAGINQVGRLQWRNSPEDRAQWLELRATEKYWHALFPFPFEEQVFRWSQQRKVNPLLTLALIRQESRFEPEIRSRSGAVGLMQVMPATGQWISGKINRGSYALDNPEDNVEMGTWYLDYTHNRYEQNSLLAVASYNAGPGNVAKWIKRYGLNDPDVFAEQIPFSETKGYVEAVFGNYWNYLRIYNPEIAQLMAQYAE